MNCRSESIDEIRVDGKAFRLHFLDSAAFEEAMRKADMLEARGLHRRAWRVRLNLDGQQPHYETPEREPDDINRGRPIGARASVPIDELRALIDSFGMSASRLSSLLGVSHTSVREWVSNGRISVMNLRKLRRMRDEHKT
jgi:hypothetical protein